MINIVRVYARTQSAQRNSFSQSLHKFSFSNASLIICGDFNIWDKFGGNPVLSSEFAKLKSNLSLIDAWGFKNLRATQFTWFYSDLSITSRLDTFLTSRNLWENILSCEICLCTFSDHEFVSLVVDLSSFVQHGPGIWTFNNSLLLNEMFCQKIRPSLNTCFRLSLNSGRLQNRILNRFQLNFVALFLMIALATGFNLKSCSCCRLFIC